MSSEWAPPAPATSAAGAKAAPLLATFVALGLAGIVPILVWSIGQPVDPTAEGVITATIVFAGIRFAWIVGSRTRHLHEIVLWLFVYTFLGVAPLLQFRIKFPGTTPNLTVAFATEAALIVLGGCVALLIGSLAAVGRRVPSGVGAMAPQVRDINGRNTYLWSFVALGLAALAIARIGPANLFVARSDLKAAQADAIGADPIGTLISSGARMGLVVAFVALMHLRAQRRKTGGPMPFLMPLAVVVTLFVVVNPISSARYTFGTALLAVLGALGAYATVPRFRVVSLSALVGVVVLFPVLDTFRRSLDATIQLESPIDSMTTGDFDAFAQIINTAELVAVQGVAYGQQFLGPFLFWIPRSVWPDKPIDTGVELAQFKMYNFPNLSAPLWSEFFINFGWVGLVVGMFAVGFLLRRLDLRAELTLQASRLPGVLACITPFYLLILLRGSLLQAMVNLFVIVAISWFVTRPESSAPAEAQTYLQRAKRGDAKLATGTTRTAG